ncbi:MAG: alpha/beta hydrolase family protein [Planctomycetaceae bacterium]
MIQLLMLTLAFSFQLPQERAGSKYDPSESAGKVDVVRTEFKYEGRTVPLKFYLPAGKKSAATIVLSHGLGGTREVGSYLGNYWAGRGYAVVAMQHAGSDADVMKNARRGLQKFQALKKAANGTAAVARYKDVRKTLDHLTELNKNGKFAGQFDLTRVGMSGHSFGAITTQAVSGQDYGPLGQRYTDKRIKAALPLSPSPPRFGFNDSTFGNVSIPWLLMTGTEDDSLISRNVDPESRRQVFPALPKAGHHYELCLEGATHFAFSDHKRGRGRNPAHHPAIQAISSAFWDTYLLDDTAAKTWLNGKGPRSVLARKDEWQRK